MAFTSLKRKFAPSLRNRLRPCPVYQCAPEKLHDSVQLTQYLIDEHDVQCAPRHRSAQVVSPFPCLEGPEQSVDAQEVRAFSLRWLHTSRQRWNRSGNSCTLPTNGQECGAPFSSRVEAVTHLEAVHSFVVRKQYVNVTLEYVHHCDTDQEWIFGRRRYEEHCLAHVLAGDALPFGGPAIPPGKDPSFHILCPGCVGDDALPMVERYKWWQRKRHGPHMADEHIRSLDAGSTTVCPVPGCDAECLYTPSKLAQHCIDDHGLHLGINQHRSKDRFIVKAGLSNLVSREGEKGTASASASSSANSATTPVTPSSAASESSSTSATAASAPPKGASANTSEMLKELSGPVSSGYSWGANCPSSCVQEALT